jgi:hypothetical protein
MLLGIAIFVGLLGMSARSADGNAQFDRNSISKARPRASIGSKFVVATGKFGPSSHASACLRGGGALDQAVQFLPCLSASTTIPISGRRLDRP